MTAPNIIKLKSKLAMCEMDSRIALIHLNEAAERPGTLENIAAYRRADRWYTTCKDREAEARAAVIAASSVQYRRTYADYGAGNKDRA